MSIYHLHIPRTSGVYVKYNVLPNLIINKIPHFISNRTTIDPEKISNSKFVGGHFGLMPLRYMENPKVFCIVRNPVERFISYFNYTTGLIRAGQEAENKLEEWLYGDQSDIQSNSQSKFLTGSMNIDKFNAGINLFQRSVNNNWFIEDYTLDLNKIYENIDKFYCYTLDHHGLFLDDMNKALQDQFNFTTFKNLDKANTSPDTGVVFTKKHIDRIIELNSIDMEVYEYVKNIKKRY